MNDLVIDASVAIKWFVSEPDSDLAERILTSSVRLVAPQLLLLEIANGLWKNVLKKLISEDDATAALREAPSIIEFLHADQSLAAQALAMAMELEHPFYDCLYIALASHLKTVCITADMRLIRAVAGTSYEQHLVELGNWRVFESTLR